MFECVKRLCSNNASAIDDEGGCALHSQLPGEIGLVLDKLGIFPGVQAGVKSGRVQAHISRKPFQVILAECTLVLSILVGEKVVMKIPILILITSTFSSFGCPL